MNSPQAPEALPAIEAPQDPTVTIDSVDTFAKAIAHWHENRVAQIQHLLTIPEGSAFEVGTDTLTMKGDILTGFKFGVELALMQFKELPFGFETEEAPADVNAG